MRLLQSYFSKKPGVLYFSMGQTLIATTPLVMTRSLTASANSLSTVPTGKAFSDCLQITRPEADRFLSAYNKKVLASRYDPAKLGLLIATGLRHNISFEDCIQRLIARKHKGQFIDRHFVPQIQHFRSLPSGIEWQETSIENVSNHIGPLARIKSSESLSYHGTQQKMTITGTETALLEEYFGLWA